MATRGRPDALRSARRSRRRAGVAAVGELAEELLELQAPAAHRDIDLLYLNDSFAAVDHTFECRGLPEEIRAKRFPHKRAFAWRGLCCEILLVQHSHAQPVTWFWGDSPLTWQAPVAHPAEVIRGDLRFSVVSVANLRLYRARHREIQPWRWQPSLGVARRRRSAARSPLRDRRSGRPDPPGRRECGCSGTRNPRWSPCDSARGGWA